MYSFGDISISKALLAGRPAAHTQFCPLFRKELRSALRALLVIMVGLGGVFHCVKFPILHENSCQPSGLTCSKVSQRTSDQLFALRPFLMHQ